MGHLNVIRGYMILLRSFLETHQFNMLAGRKLWILVCIEKINSKFYDFDEKHVDLARK